MFLEFSRVYAGTFGGLRVPAYTREDFRNYPSQVSYLSYGGG